MTTPLNYQTSYCEQHNIVMVNAQGMADVYQIETMYRDIVTLTKAKGWQSIIVNAMQVQQEYPLLQLIPLIHRLAPILQGYKLARICNTYEHRQDLIESVGLKQQLSIKNFASDHEALAWLCS